MESIPELRNAYSQRKAAIGRRLAEFRSLGRRAGGKELFAELAFCLLTPQSKARSCDVAVRKLLSGNALFTAPKTKIAKVIRSCVRFHNHKAGYIEEARKKLLQGENGGGTLRSLLPESDGEQEAVEKRDALVEKIKGLGMKEASHFMRNVGYGEHIAILDRHIMRNLKKYGALKGVPSSLTRKKYLEIEGEMRKFARKVKIPPSHLDLLFWSEETGEIFK